MTKYEIELYRSYMCIDRALVCVEAASEEEAIAKAEELRDTIPEEHFKPVSDGHDTEWEMNVVHKEN